MKYWKIPCALPWKKHIASNNKVGDLCFCSFFSFFFTPFTIFSCCLYVLCIFLWKYLLWVKLFVLTFLFLDTIKKDLTHCCHFCQCHLHCYCVPSYVLVPFSFSTMYLMAAVMDLLSLQPISLNRMLLFLYFYVNCCLLKNCTRQYSILNICTEATSYLLLEISRPMFFLCVCQLKLNQGL